MNTNLSSRLICLYSGGSVFVHARATHQHIHTNTLRGLKIYLLFNRLVRRFVMSVNVHVNVRRCMAVDDCLQWSVHVSVSAR
jgi:hypothetical protein